MLNWSRVLAILGAIAATAAWLAPQLTGKWSMVLSAVGFFLALVVKPQDLPPQSARMPLPDAPKTPEQKP